MKIRFKFKEKSSKLINFVEKNSWFFTIFIFFLVLVLAVFVWNDCILNPKPSQTALDNILKTEKEYQQKMDKIKENDGKIKERMQNFNNPSVNLEDRKYFKQIIEGDFSKINYQSNNKNYNPELVN